MTYANEAKVKYCGVKPETLEAYGAVSEQTAQEMACGLREKSGADIAVATTGIAGPGGGTKESPLGLVYVACADKFGVQVEKLNLGGRTRTGSQIGDAQGVGHGGAGRRSGNKRRSIWQPIRARKRLRTRLSRRTTATRRSVHWILRWRASKSSSARAQSSAWVSALSAISR